MRFRHHTDNTLVARRNLTRHVGAYVHLAPIVLGTVGMGKIDHQALLQPGRRQLPGRCVHARGVIVGLGPAAQNHMAVVVAIGGNNGRVPAFGDRKKMMRLARSLDRVHRNPDIAVGAVLESNRTGQPRGKLAVHLRLRGARADRAPAHQVGDVLRRDHVEVLHPGRHAQLIDVEQHVARQAQALVDAERAVEVRVVDEALPTHGGARLLEIDSHHDEQVGCVPDYFLCHALRILQRRFGVVDRARADDHQQPVICRVQYAVYAVARLVGDALGRVRYGKLADCMRGRREFFDFADADVVNLVGHDFS